MYPADDSSKSAWYVGHETKSFSRYPEDAAATKNGGIKSRGNHVHEWGISASKQDQVI